MLYSAKKDRSCLLLAILALACLAVLPAPLRAQSLPGEKNVSTSEDVAFTFYKLSGTQPDFKRWADRTDIPESVSVAEYPAYKRTLLQRLIAHYKAYDPEKLLTVQIKTTVLLRTPSKHLGTGAFVPGATLSLGSDTKTPYFPYRVADQWISVIVKDLGRIQSIDLPGDELEKFKQAFHVTGISPRQGTLRLTLRPLSADAKTPMRLDGIDQWLLMTEIVRASLWTAEGSLVWDIQDKNYISPEQKEIEGLFRD